MKARKKAERRPTRPTIFAIFGRGPTLGTRLVSAESTVPDSETCRAAAACQPESGRSASAPAGTIAARTRDHVTSSLSLALARRHRGRCRRRSAPSHWQTRNLLPPCWRPGATASHAAATEGGSDRSAGWVPGPPAGGCQDARRRATHDARPPPGRAGERHRR